MLDSARIWGGDDTHCRGARTTKDTSELSQPESRVGKELQAKLAYNSVKAAVLERQCLAVRSHLPKQRFVQPVACSFEHRGRDVRSNHETRSADDRERHHRSFSRSGGYIEHSAARPQRSRGK